MQVVLQKVDRRSKPIKKQEKIVNKNLKKKNINLEEENFDILTLLQKNNNQINSKADEKKNSDKLQFAKPNTILKQRPLKSDKDRMNTEINSKKVGNDLISLF